MKNKLLTLTFVLSFISATIAQTCHFTATISSITDPLCNGASTGTASVSVTGGYPTKYAWSNGATTQTISKLAAGTYTVTVTEDTTGCTSSTIATINQPVAMVITTPEVAASCGLADGSVSATVTGGTPPYKYLWQPGGDSTANLTGLTAGTFSISVNVTDAKGCSQTAFAPTLGSIAAPVIQLQTVSAILTACDGSATATVTGGTAPYKFNWSNGDLTAIAANLCKGTFKLTITDAVGCKVYDSVNVASTAGTNTCTGFSINVSGTATLLSSCAGTATASITGGTAPYTYSWSNFFNTQSISNLCPANYAVTVTDSKGCTAGRVIKILGDTILKTFPLNIFVNTTDASAVNNCDGTAHITVSGGTSPYTYTYSTGATGATAAALCPNSYLVLVTDHKGVKDSLYFVISAPTITLHDTTGAKQTSLADSSIVATVAGNAVQNCSLNLASIDSINLASYGLLGTDSVSVIWNVFIGNTPTAITNHYPVGPSGVYTVILELFCNGNLHKPDAANAGFIKATAKVYIKAVNTGIADIKLNKTNVFPIPFTGILNITPSGNELKTVSVYDVCGKLLMNSLSLVGQSTYSINLSALSNGYYMLKIASADHIEFVKIVKE